MKKGNAIDTSLIMPEIDRITLVDRERRRKGEACEFEVELFVPARAGIVLIQEVETVQRLMNGEIDDEAASLVYRLFSAVFIKQHEFMTPEWCEANIDLAQTVVILTQIALPLYRYLESSGLIGNAETPDEKNPS